MTLIPKHDQNFKVPEVQKTYLYLWEEKKQSSEGKINLLCMHKYTIALYTFIQGFPCGSTGKGSACNVGDLGSIPGLGRSPGKGKGYPVQYSGLENSMDCIVHGVAKSQKQLSDFHFHIHSITLQKKKNSKDVPGFRIFYSRSYRGERS